MATVRRLFLDSRFAEGTPGDFTFQLPRDVVTKRGQVLALGAISFPNHFETIGYGFNDILYFEKLALGSSPPARYQCAFRITPGQYDGPAFATELSRVLSQGPADQHVVATYLPQQGAIRVACSVQSSYQLRIYRMQDVQSPDWLFHEWFGEGSFPQGELFDVGNPCAANALLPSPNEPRAQFDTNNIDITGCLREVYVHCSISDNGSLSSCGAMDVLAVIPLLEAWGSVVNWRPYGPIDSQSIVLQDGALSTIRFYLMDAYNRPLPLTESYVFLELSILDVPTM
jgi:hypothetical protein